MPHSRYASALLSLILVVTLVPALACARPALSAEDVPAPSASGQTAGSAPPAPAIDSRSTRGGSVPARNPALTVTGPQYGMHLFIWDAPETSARDLRRVVDLGFTWQKTLFQWRLIEPQKGVYDWREAERVVKASNEAGIRVFARVDFQPLWARADRAHNGPPDRYSDFSDFVFALVDHFKPGSPHGTISAIELWNEPNLWRDWGYQVIERRTAADYVRLLCMGHDAAKRANPQIITVTAGLTPTGTLSTEAADDTVFLQWMYESGAKACFDALGTHAAGFKAPPWIGPDELASNADWGGHASFGFRRIEQLRDVMVRNGDAAKQVWLTEFGWSSDPINPGFSWHRVTEEEKAEYVVEAFRWAYSKWQPWIGVMVLWNIPSPDWPTTREEYWWGIMNPDGSSRPAYDALIEARRSGYLPMHPKDGETPEKLPRSPLTGDVVGPGGAPAGVGPGGALSAGPASSPTSPAAATAAPGDSIAGARRDPSTPLPSAADTTSSQTPPWPIR